MMTTNRDYCKWLKQHINSAGIMNLLILPVDLRLSQPNLGFASGIPDFLTPSMFIPSVLLISQHSSIFQSNSVNCRTSFMSEETSDVHEIRLSEWNKIFYSNRSQMFMCIKIMWVERECTNTDSMNPTSPK